MTAVRERPRVARGVRLARDWTALGTYVEVRVDDAAALDPASRVVADVLDLVDRTCSRFRTDSDLSRANRRFGLATEVDALLVGAVRAAVAAAEWSDGLVDPCLGGAMVAAGYHDTYRSIAQVKHPRLPAPLVPRAWRDIAVTDATITVPPGVSLDLGAVGKAYAADLAALEVVERLRIPVLVGVGGDVRIAAPPEDERTWRVDVADSAAAHAAGATVALALGSGGIATSSTTARRWANAGETWHHVLDPRTGRPAPPVWRSVTVMARSAAAANAASTAGIVLGERAVSWLAERGVAARLVDGAGAVLRTPAWGTEERAA